MNEAGEQHIAKCMTLHLALGETVLHGCCQIGFGCSQRHEALTEVTEGGDTQDLAEATARSPVVCH
jgi:hypothetical protein